MTAEMKKAQIGQPPERRERERERETNGVRTDVA